jgi:uncharacterized protein YutE (UPF0331/DUF86 family)
VIRLLSGITRDIGFLRRFEAWTATDLLADEVSLSAVKYRFTTAIEGCAKVAHHLCVSEGWSVPESNADAIGELGRRDVLAATLTTRLRAATGFRNVLVHHYAEVDDARVAANLGHIDDLDQFVLAVGHWLGASG